MTTPILYIIFVVNIAYHFSLQVVQKYFFTATSSGQRKFSATSKYWYILVTVLYTIPTGVATPSSALHNTYRFAHVSSICGLLLKFRLLFACSAEIVTLPFVLQCPSRKIVSHFLTIKRCLDPQISNTLPLSLSTLATSLQSVAYTRANLYH